ncbi:hypothetical protein [Candidatus Magnetobacterium casense]|uniref:Uncharacterized protein n=1 Tax=Candidatus Magnetobacterium casense TaxID=1455061 RepID=A0ABS6S0E3_9BACT|nr:hypothetical protein [Candidatus Magnetobacterium casensis]MBV6341859.1 hypothetical protein [Candidatus Magnetobacterium casensis]
MIKNTGAFFKGIVIAACFFGLLFLIFSPVFGDGKNGLVYADDMFNKLAKGSSHFIPALIESNKKKDERPISVTVNLDKPEEAELAGKLFTAAGVKAGVNNGALSVEGSLGKLLGVVLEDSEAMFQNKGEQLEARYAQPGKTVMKAWWGALSKMTKKLEKDGKVKEAKDVNTVVKKAVEPAYNFYGIQPQKVSDKLMLLIGLLVFYVFYTIMWGYAIFFVFEGLGLSMKKAKH